MKQLLEHWWPTLILWVVIIPVYWGLGYTRGKLKMFRVVRRLYNKKSLDKIIISSLNNDEMLKLSGAIESYRDILDEFDNPENAAWPIKQLNKVKKIIRWI